jgi:hypothetical protein
VSTLEKNLERTFIRRVEKAGGRAVKLQGRGLPDRMVLLPGGRVLFVELKQLKGRLTLHQEFWMEELAALGFETRVVRSLEDMDL